MGISWAAPTSFAQQGWAMSLNYAELGKRVIAAAALLATTQSGDDTFGHQTRAPQAVHPVANKEIRR